MIDISNPANPLRVAPIETNVSMRTVRYADGYAYVTQIPSGLSVIDVRDPMNPRKVGAVDTGRNREALAISGNYAFAAGGDGLGSAGLEVFDISNPIRPQQIGSYSYTTNDYAPGVAVAGNYAYLGYSGWGLLVIDISNPANPRRVGGNLKYSNALDVTVAGDKVFVVDGGGLVILNTITPPLRFEPLARFDAGTFRFSLGGLSGQSARVQRSDNLRDWLDWQTVTLGNSPIVVADPEATVQRFYRAVTP